MAEREKVIKAIECCATDDLMVDCEICPYERDGNGMAKCINRLMLDAAELLKAQEPRVLMLAEVKLKAPVWCETRLKNKYLYQGWGLTYDVQTGQGITGRRIGMAEPSGHVRWLPFEKYGETWRFWSSEPTDEQREAVKWDG